MRVFISFRELTKQSQPCRITRKEDMTLIVCQPGADRCALLRQMRILLTVGEQNYLRAAYGMGPVGEPLAAWALTTEVVIPLSLQTPDEQRRQSQTWAKDLGLTA